MCTQVSQYRLLIVLGFIIIIEIEIHITIDVSLYGSLRGLTGSAIGHIYIYSTWVQTTDSNIRRVFHLSLGLIIFGGRSPHLAYLVHKGGRKYETFIWPTK